MKIREMANSFFEWGPSGANKIALLDPPRIYFVCGFRNQ
jgi:hypothetical protein